MTEPLTIYLIKLANGGELHVQRVDGEAIRITFEKGPRRADCCPTRDEAKELIDALRAVFEL